MGSRRLRRDPGSHPRGGGVGGESGPESGRCTKTKGTRSKADHLKVLGHGGTLWPN